MVFKSPFPDVPPLPDQNIHDFIFAKERIPAQDYVVHIDALTGEKRTRDEFLERVRIAATALCQPQPAGPGIDVGREIVGILSHNSLVSLPAEFETRVGLEGRELLSPAPRIISLSFILYLLSQPRSHFYLPMRPRMNWATLCARPKQRAYLSDRTCMQSHARQPVRSGYRKSGYSCSRGESRARKVWRISSTMLENAVCQSRQRDQQSATH